MVEVTKEPARSIVPEYKALRKEMFLEERNLSRDKEGGRKKYEAYPLRYVEDSFRPLEPVVVQI